MFENTKKIVETKHHIMSIEARFEDTLRGHASAQLRQLEEPEKHMMRTFHSELSKHADENGLVRHEHIQQAYKNTIANFRSSKHMTTTSYDSYMGRRTRYRPDHEHHISDEIEKELTQQHDEPFSQMGITKMRPY